MNLPEGTLLANGRYRIVRFLAGGGFGRTYLAVHTGLCKRVAIKEFFYSEYCQRDAKSFSIYTYITKGRSTVEHLRKKFKDEAQALANLRHPHIVPVSDVFDENNTSYYVMDYIEGQSLESMVNRGPLPLSKALDYILQVCEALRYVHAHNRLHLDLKPANIMVERETNHAILIDFGVSKQYDMVNNNNNSILLGHTPGYPPLEQNSENVQTFYPATDIYALGATLYKLLTGITPPKAIDLATEEARLIFPDSIPLKVRQTIVKSMELKRNLRLQSINEFLACLGTKETPKADPKETTKLEPKEATKLEPKVNKISKEIKNTPPARPTPKPVTTSQKPKESGQSTWGTIAAVIGSWWTWIGIAIVTALIFYISSGDDFFPFIVASGILLFRSLFSNKFMEFYEKWF